MEDRFLSVDNITTGYNNHKISDGISFFLKRGESLCILGPNGEGKSTLLKTLLGILTPLSGSIRYQSVALKTLSMRARARLFAYVPQNSSPNFSFSVLQMVLMGKVSELSVFQQPTKTMYDEAMSILEKLEIAHLADKYYPRVSGGERQLILIARALLQNANLIVLDEPTASLDFSNQDKLMRLLAQVKDDGHNILFTTHHPDQACYFSDQLMMLKDGHVMAIGKTQSVLNETNLGLLYNANVGITEINGKKITYIKE